MSILESYNITKKYINKNKKINKYIYIYIYIYMGTEVAQWLRCCATNRKVAGSIPGGVIGILH